MTRKIGTLLVLFFVTGAVAFGQKFDKLALTPPMGWNSWNKIGCDVNEQFVREAADAIVASGMKAAGYQYVVIDDCWHGTRDSLGFIRPDPQRFPSGMKALAEYVHGKGLKFGIYSCAGNKTCGGRPGSRGHEYQDALTYARWGVDYLKYDWCDSEGLNSVAAYTTMRDALFAAGRPVVFSLCEWGDTKSWEWGANVGHLWRTTGDITNCFDCVVNHGTWNQWGVMKIVELREGIRGYAGPDHWNDPDMLEVGNGMTLAEDRSHFSLWCMMAAPLMAGNDLKNMTAQTIGVLTNPEVVAIDQDSLGVQGFKVETKDSVEMWVKPLVHSDWAVCFINRSIAPRTIDQEWSRSPITDDVSKLTLSTQEHLYKLRNLWTRKDAGTTQRKLAVILQPHDVLLFRLTEK
jgi:alpha-galactosidase